MSKLLPSAFALVAGLTVAAVSMAAPQNFTHATGGIGLSNPLQYVSFNAFDYGATGDRGTVAYTNFGFPVPGTGVWNVGGTYELDVLGGAYKHSMTIDTIVPISTTATKFSGEGFYEGDPVCTWTVSGMVSGSNISFTIVYDPDCAAYAFPYSFSAVGTIAADGSMSGTATDSLGQPGLTWSVAAGSVAEVFSYTASVSCAVITATDARFVFTIPVGVPLAGTPVVAKVHDGGTPGTNGDTWAHGVATSACDGPTNPYPIVSGNLVVH